MHADNADGAEFVEAVCVRLSYPCLPASFTQWPPCDCICVNQENLRESASHPPQSYVSKAGSSPGVGEFSKAPRRMTSSRP